MLVLSRKVGETIQIGADITLVVIRGASGRVQIGIDAPREVSVRRGELTIRPRFSSSDLSTHAQHQPLTKLIEATGEGDRRP